MQSMEPDDSDIYEQTSFPKEMILLMARPLITEGKEKRYITSIEGVKFYWSIAIKEGEGEGYRPLRDISKRDEEKWNATVNAITARASGGVTNAIETDPFADMSNTPS